LKKREEYFERFE